MHRLRPTGEPDSSWAGDGSSSDDPGVREDGRLLLPAAGGALVAGTSEAVGGEEIGFSAPRIARFGADGTLDETFDGDGRAIARLGAFAHDWVTDVLPGLSGGARLVGYAHFGDRESRIVVLATRPDGTRDPAWGDGGLGQLAGGKLTAADAAALPDGGVAVAGHDRDADVLMVGRFGADGRAAPGFGAGGLARVAPPGTEEAGTHAVAPAPGGGVFVAGSVRQDQAYASVAFARLTPAGTVDRGYGDDGWVILPGDQTGAHPVIQSVVVAADGTATVVVSGPTLYHQVTAFRLTPDGNPDPGFGDQGFVVVRETAGYARASGALLDARGRLVMVVSEDAPDSVETIDVVALDARGRPDGSFGGGAAVRFPTRVPQRQPTAMTVDAAGRLLVTGGQDASWSNPWGTAFVARLAADGTFDESFGPDGIVVAPPKDERTPGSAAGVVAQPDGRIVVGGTAGRLEFKLGALALVPAPEPTPEPTSPAAPTPTPAPAGRPPGGPAAPGGKPPVPAGRRLPPGSRSPPRGSAVAGFRSPRRSTRPRRDRYASACARAAGHTPGRSARTAERCASSGGCPDGSRPPAAGG